MDSDDEPWGMKDEETPPRYRPSTEDITDDEGPSSAPPDGAKAGRKLVKPNHNEVNAAKSSGTYKCNMCSFGTDDFMQFITHKNEHTEKKSKMSLFTCGMCEFTTPDPELMSRHIHSHLLSALPVALPSFTDRNQAAQCESVAEFDLKKKHFAENTNSGGTDDLTSTVSKIIDYVETTSVPNLCTESQKQFINGESINKNVTSKWIQSKVVDDDVLTISQCSQPSDEVELSHEAEVAIDMYSSPDCLEHSVPYQVTKNIPSINIGVPTIIKENRTANLTESLQATNCLNAKRESTPGKPNIDKMVREDRLVLSEKPTKVYGRVKNGKINNKISETTSGSTQPSPSFLADRTSGQGSLLTFNNNFETNVQGTAKVPEVLSKRTTAKSCANKNSSVTIPSAVACRTTISNSTLKNGNIPITVMSTSVESCNTLSSDFSADYIVNQSEDGFIATPNRIIDRNYKHSSKFLLSYHGDKGKVIATDKGVKTLRPVKPSSQMANKAIAKESENAQISRNYNKKRIPVRVKLSRTAKVSKGTVGQDKKLRSSTRLSCAKANSSQGSLELYTARKRQRELPELPTQDVKTPPLCKPVKSVEQGEKAIDKEKGNVVNQTTNISDKIPSNTPLLDAKELRTKLATKIISDGVAAPPEYKKPKKAILLRYQEEMSRSTSPETVVTENPVDCNQEADLKEASSLIPAEISMNMKSAVSTTRKTLDDVAESFVGLPCKIVLSRCSSSDLQIQSPPKLIASKLKSKLKNWKGAAALRKHEANNKPITPETPNDVLQPNARLQRFRTKRKSFHCKMCIYSTFEEALFIAHTSQMHSKDEDMYFCDSCDYITSRESKLIAHSKIHKEAPVEVVDKDECPSDKTAIQECKNEPTDEIIDVGSSLEPTVESAMTQEDPLLFEITNVRTIASTGSKEPSEGFWNSTNVKNQERPYACKKCPYRARKYYNLQIHERTHTGESRIYECKYCTFTAARWKTFVEHQLNCHKDEPLCCYACNYTTSNPRMLKKHRISAHRMLPPLIKCDICHLTYTRKDSFEAHYSKHFGKTISGNNLEERPFKCPNCPFAAKKLAGLRKHMPIHSAKKSIYRCRSCGFRSHMRAMLLRHTNQSPNCRKPLIPFAN